MRYATVGIVSFTDARKRKVPVRDFREVPAHVIMSFATRAEDEHFDAIAARPEVYGDMSEGLTYKLHEASMTTILDRGFDYSTLRRIPVPE